MPVIKRYANRKLYDTESSRYLTLDEIGEMVRSGQDVRVVDHATGADLTPLVFSQIIFETEKKIGGMLPRAFLGKLIRYSDHAWDNIRSELVTFLEPAPTVEDEIRRRVDQLCTEGSLSDEEAQRLQELLLAAKARPAAALPAEEEPVDPQEVERLLLQVEELEKQIRELQP
jgi:polyhydroxyalkanoate synthesis repressor PhaR